MNYYDEIKNELVNNEINKKIKNYSINRSDLNTYYNVGKLLLEAGKNYGEGIIKEYSIKLTNDLNIKYDVSTLNKMRKFYNLIENIIYKGMKHIIDVILIFLYLLSKERLP